MFESVITEIAGKFGLGDQAPVLVKLVLGYITDPANGGLGGLMAKFDNAGLGAVAQSWLGSDATPAPLAPTQVESVFGGAGSGLLGTVTSKLGIPAATASAAVGAILPALISKLTPGGVLPTSLPDGVAGFLGGLGGSAKTAFAGANGAATGAAAYTTAAASGTAAPAAGGLSRWLPWIIGAIALIALYFYFTRKHEAAPALTETITTAPAVTPAAEPVPTGSGVTANTVGGVPSLTVYFDTGKAEIASEFASKASGVVDYLKTASPDAKLVVSGFNDPTGNAAFNAELSKKRAQAVAAALKAAGADAARVVLEKPADTTGTGDTNAESRRVEVVVRQ